jgi:methanogenic corrinoid protein MtbC1
LIKQVRDTEAGENLKILVGGYPFKNSPDLWEKLGADAFAEDAAGAIEKANSLVAG